ncbi:MAG: BON domain-containing protein [Chitinophagaceae bacterium]|nr:BON domain-containing protein [Rubrivivax sp.]
MKTVILVGLLALTTLSGCAVSSGQSSVGQYVDDATIATRVKARFAEDSSVSAARIQVEVLNGTVQLAGFATSQAEKDKAGQLARGISDVKDVRNNIIVRSPGS